jgi:hypothetical protein
MLSHSLTGVGSALATVQGASDEGGALLDVHPLSVGILAATIIAVLLSPTLTARAAKLLGKDRSNECGDAPPGPGRNNEANRSSDDHHTDADDDDLSP